MTPEEYAKLIPLRLKIVRIARGFSTMTAFASACGVPMPRYRTHELGESAMTAVDIIRYAKTLKISIQWLLTGEGSSLDEAYHPTPQEKAEFDYQIKLELLNMEQISQEVGQEAKKVLASLKKEEDDD